MCHKFYNSIKAIKVKKKRLQQKDTLPSQIEVILEAIREKKGEHLTTIDLRNIGDAVCDFFVLCDASSTPQVKAIAENIEERTKKELGERPWHIEGTGQLQWVLLDYVNTVVHVFQRDVRGFYQIEELWSDGIIEEHND